MGKKNLNSAPLDFESRDSEHVSIIYEQRYQHLRHFDQMRWKIPALVFGAAAAILSIHKNFSKVPPVLILIFGIFALANTWLMIRIKIHSDNNIRVLRAAANALGDHSFPSTTKHYLSASIWFIILTGSAGVAAIIWAIVLLTLPTEITLTEVDL